MLIKLDYVFTFGKYKGKDVCQVLDQDPSYLDWANKNIDWFELSYPIKIIVESTDDDDRYSDCYGAIDVYDFCD